MLKPSGYLDVIVRYLNNPQDEKLHAAITSFRQESAANEKYFVEIKSIWDLSSKSAQLDLVNEKELALKLEKQLQQLSPKGRKARFGLSITPFVRWAAAAVIFLGLSVLLYTYLADENKQIQHTYASDVAPGGNKAILTLSDGQKISLNDMDNGDIAKQAGIAVTKTADGQLIYEIKSIEGADTDHSLAEMTNTISTPRGGQWQVRLPDGSIVWLNAASSLTYPLTFKVGKQRRVELIGEAYFEVAKDKGHPFVVHTAKQEVEVLGTHFNINSYLDEPVTKTTLLEGSIRVAAKDSHNAKILKPGEQSMVSANGINISEIDVEEAVAWKNGYFMFNNEKQESIMRKISRWYNVEVEYADPLAKEVMYYGSISRFEKVSQILRKFEQTGEVRFEIKGNKITVYKEDKKD
jgi:transmembrane sensor